MLQSHGMILTALLVTAVYFCVPFSAAAAPAAPDGLRMPFVQTQVITTGPQCDEHAGDNAIDYGTSVGTSLYAVEGGTIHSIGASDTALGGFAIRIYHPVQGLYSYYAHLRDDPTNNWPIGHAVKKGEYLGVSGKSGRTASGQEYLPHLHFRVESSAAALPGVDIYNMEKHIWNNPNNRCENYGNHGQAKGSQIAGRVLRQNGPASAESQWLASGPLVILLGGPGPAPPVYADRQGYFQVFDVASGAYSVITERFHYNDPVYSNETSVDDYAPTVALSIAPFSPDNGSTIFLSSSAATTLNDVAPYLCDTSLAVNDNVVTSLDYSTVVSFYGTQQGDPTYRQDADFDESNRISAVDFSLVINNFGDSGPGWLPVIQNGIVYVP